MRESAPRCLAGSDAGSHAGWAILLHLSRTAPGLWVSLAASASPFPPTARSERYRHLGSEDDETNDEESSTEIPQFSSCSHRFSKVGWLVAVCS